MRITLVAVLLALSAAAGFVAGRSNPRSSGASATELPLGAELVVKRPTGVIKPVLGPAHPTYTVTRLVVCGRRGRDTVWGDQPQDRAGWVVTIAGTDYTAVPAE